MHFDNVEKGSPEEVLLGLKTGKTTYAMVFDTMCKYVGVKQSIQINMKTYPTKKLDKKISNSKTDKNLQNCKTVKGDN